MNETVILVSLIVGFFAITIFALGALIVVRRREQTRHDSKGMDDAIARMDSALDSALVEINKIGTLVKSEMDEKYQAMLFLYDLIDNKKKEIEEIPEVDTTMISQYLESHVAKLNMSHSLSEVLEDDINPIDVLLNREVEEIEEVEVVRERPVFANPRHAQIWDLRQEGKAVSEIAKEMGMGKGEVQLILNLAEKM